MAVLSTCLRALSSIRGPPRHTHYLHTMAHSGVGVWWALGGWELCRLSLSSLLIGIFGQGSLLQEFCRLSSRTEELDPD